ncbi:hypothetical protein O1611_g6514 [Lasiodiplodia mahajangana]|uniref:Uncharacterized protein n=1 Tax=Lasiodiplodia mahajangana TaxID=1108764 RepID=A0ACC2JI70_9PEZI|nr:hypothetical protein O1611_g6514 [Lasiodiplodia mahajangana]
MSLGPLTTTYEPPPSCTASFLTDFRPMDAWDIMGPLETRGDCFPRNYEDDAKKYYSPGICPAGYTVACADLALGPSGGPTLVTTATCCPMGFTCISEPYMGITGSTFVCNSRIQSFSGTQVLLSSGSAWGTRIGSISASQNAIANAFGVQIQYRHEDFVSTSTIISTPSSLSSSVASITTSKVPSSIFPSESFSIPSSTPPLTQPTDTETGGKKPQNGLKTAAALGIGLGAGVIGTILIGGSIWAICARRYRARKLLNKPMENVSQIDYMGMEQALVQRNFLGHQELSAEAPKQPIPELDSNRQYELDVR